MPNVRKPSTSVVPVLLVLILFGGIAARLINITADQFFYYDEGMWLENGRPFLSQVNQNPPHTLSEYWQFINISFHLSLRSAKSLWAFISNLRGITGGADALYFTRVVSAVCGGLTLILLYVFSNKYYSNRTIALLSTALLALLPSHLFYSRIALQEALSALLFLSGLYLYLFPKHFSLRSIVAALMMGLLFLSNYRMIIVPLFILFADVFLAFANKEKPTIKKFIIFLIVYVLFVASFSLIDNGANARVTFGWMGRQTQLAKGHFDVLSLFSYPVGMFLLEGALFGLFFFANIFFLAKKKLYATLPFVMVCFAMVVFSFGQEKGTRYMTFMMPIMCMAVAYAVYSFYTQAKSNGQRNVVLSLVALLALFQVIKDAHIINFNSDYKDSLVAIQTEEKKAKLLSSQFVVQRLYVDNALLVQPIPKDWQALVAFRTQGFRYLVVDPQAYVSYTSDQLRFSPPLIGYLEFIRKNVPPYRIYPHFSSDMLTRFVLEHNENLVRSLRFLHENKKEFYSQLMVYRIDDCLAFMKEGIERYNNQRGALSKP